VVWTGTGERIGYDALLVATGASARRVLPGALTFRGRQDVPEIRTMLEQIDAREVASVAFALPRPARWSMPLYELALMTAARAATHGVPLRVELATHEREPLAIFGPRVSRRI